MRNAAISVLAFVCSFPIAAEDCSAVLRDGVFDTTTTTDDRALASSFVNWFQTAYSRNSGQAKESGWSGAASYKLFSASGGASDHFKNWDQVETSAAEYRSGNASEASHLAKFARTASPLITDAWKECMNRYGLSVTMKWTADPNVFYIVFQFVPSNPTDHPTTTILELSPSKGLECDPVPSQGEKVSSAAVAKRCTRTANVPVSVSFRATDATLGVPVFSIPAVPADFAPRKPTVNLISSFGGTDENHALDVSVPFSRIRNKPSDREYEWFSFAAPSDGFVEIRLSGVKTEVAIRVKDFPDLADATDLVIKSSDAEGKQWKSSVLSGKRYRVGIQKLGSGATGVQLDVAFSKSR